MTSRIGASGARESTAQAPGLHGPGRKPAPRTGASEAAARVGQKDKETPRIGASGEERSTALAPGLDRPGANPVPRTGAPEATGRVR